MGLLTRMHGAVDRLGNLPPLRGLRRRAFERRFRSGEAGHAFLGVFESFEAASASAPAALPVGYDNPASAEMYTGRLDVDDHDYPALFWLGQSLQRGARVVVDLGGSVGIKFFAFRKLLDYPADLVWRVIEVPAAVRRGREFALGQGAGAALEFSETVGSADGSDLLFASGSLQYLPQSLPEILRTLSRLPRRLLVNTTPIHPTRAYFTLNCIGTAFCPYRVQAHATFVGEIEALGYRLRAEWRNLHKALAMPFHPGYGLEHYAGFCFDAIPSHGA